MELVYHIMIVLHIATKLVKSTNVEHNIIAKLWTCIYIFNNLILPAYLIIKYLITILGVAHIDISDDS